MAKAKRGQRVGHRGTKKSGVISSVVRGIAHVVWDDGSHSKVHAGSLHKSGGGGCVILLAAPLMIASFAATAAIYPHL